MSEHQQTTLDHRRQILYWTLNNATHSYLQRHVNTEFVSHHPM